MNETKFKDAIDVGENGPCCGCEWAVPVFRTDSEGGSVRATLFCVLAAAYVRRRSEITPGYLMKGQGAPLQEVRPGCIAATMHNGSTYTEGWGVNSNPEEDVSGDE